MSFGSYSFGSAPFAGGLDILDETEEAAPFDPTDETDETPTGESLNLDNLVSVSTAWREDHSVAIGGLKLDNTIDN